MELIYRVESLAPIEQGHEKTETPSSLANWTVFRNHNNTQRNPNPSGPTKTNRLLVSEIRGMLAVLSYGTPMLALLRTYTLLA